VLTLYAFSIENWKRPSDEVNALMGLLNEYLQKECEEMVQNNIRLNAIGRIEDLPLDVQTTLQETMEKTKNCDGMILNLALSYGGRSEILHAVQGILSYLQKGKIKPEEITVQYRISNFLLWQIAYTELYVTETLWPDFDRKELLKAIADYQSRERRFGLTSEQLNGREE
jgi:undecaprenyl diphosphate synthase